MASSRPVRRGPTYHGSKWIRREKRLAIYIRDGLACLYCGKSVEDAVVLSLDHLKPYHNGGSHEHTNLVTACVNCNSGRGKRSVASFCRVVAAYTGEPEASVLARVRNAARRTIDVPSAKALIEQRGGFAASLCKE